MLYTQSLQTRPPQLEDLRSPSSDIGLFDDTFVRFYDGAGAKGLRLFTSDIDEEIFAHIANIQRLSGLTNAHVILYSAENRYLPYAAIGQRIFIPESCVNAFAPEEVSAFIAHAFGHLQESFFSKRYLVHGTGLGVGAAIGGLGAALYYKKTRGGNKTKNISRRQFIGVLSGAGFGGFLGLLPTNYLASNFIQEEERNADRFVVQCGLVKALISGLIKIKRNTQIIGSENTHVTHIDARIALLNKEIAPYKQAPYKQTR